MRFFPPGLARKSGDADGRTKARNARRLSSTWRQKRFAGFHLARLAGRHCELWREWAESLPVRRRCAAEQSSLRPLRWWLLRAAKPHRSFLRQLVCYDALRYSGPRFLHLLNQSLADLLSVRALPGGVCA